MTDKAFTARQLEKLGERIKAIRKAKGYTNYEHFAYQNGFNRVQYGRYENGANISFKTLVKLVAAFDMTLAEFFSEGFDDQEGQEK
ncbi:MAG: helix-turn-helix transcriptional regulator [Bacteroidota bacterium]